MLPETVPRLVVEDKDWEMLRVIRNTCRHGMTDYTGEISIEQQHIYATKMSINPFVRHYLYSFQGIDIGFSRLDWAGGFVYLTYGVASWARGNKFAWSIAKHLMLAAGEPLKGNLLTSNIASQRVLYGLGFIPEGPEKDGVQNITCSWPPPFLKDML